MNRYALFHEAALRAASFTPDDGSVADVAVEQQVMGYLAVLDATPPEERVLA